MTEQNVILNPSLRNPFPAIHLESAIEYARLIRTNLPQSSFFNRVTLMEKGLELPKKVGGRGDNIVSSLSHFGLLERLQTDYRLTYLAASLLEEGVNSGKYYDLLLRAFISPELYSALYSRFGRGPLPENIESLILDQYKSVDASSIPKAVKNYKLSLDFLLESKPMESTVAFTEVKAEGKVSGDLIAIDLGEGVVLRMEKSTILEVYNTEAEKIRQRLV